MTARKGRLRYLWVVAGLLAFSAVVFWGLTKYNAHQTAKQQAAIQRVEAIGGKLRMIIENPWSRRIPSWAFRWRFVELFVSNQYRTYPTKVALEGIPVTDENFREFNLHDLASITELSIQSTAMTGRSLEEVSKLSRLKELLLTNVDLTTADLQHLVGLHSLEDLTLHGTSTDRLSAGDFQCFSKLRSLAALRLCGPAVTDRSLANLRGCLNLRHLALTRAAVTREGFKRLSSWFPRLNDLFLDDSTIADDDLIHLKEFKSLSRLGLDGSDITDKGLVLLRDMTTLRSLSLMDVDSISVENISELSDALPNCIIIFGESAHRCPECGGTARQWFNGGKLQGTFTCGHLKKESAAVQD